MQPRRATQHAFHMLMRVSCSCVHNVAHHKPVWRCASVSKVRTGTQTPGRNTFRCTERLAPSLIVLSTHGRKMKISSSRSSTDGCTCRGEGRRVGVRERRKLGAHLSRMMTTRIATRSRTAFFCPSLFPFLCPPFPAHFLLEKKARMKLFPRP